MGKKYAPEVAVDPARENTVAPSELGDELTLLAQQTDDADDKHYESLFHAINKKNGHCRRDEPPT
jgi:hypothetical protein